MTRPILQIGLAAVMAMLLTLTACGSLPGSTQPSDTTTATPNLGPTETPTPTPHGSDLSTSAPTSGPNTAPAQPSMPADARPIRTLRGAFEDKAVTAEIYPIERGATTATVNIRFRLRKPDLIGFRIYQSLSDHKPELSDRGKTAPDGLRLIDTTAGKAYLPATIGSGECLCSPRVNSAYDRVDEVTVTVAFAAPPTAVTSMDLMVPGFGTVSDVPVR